MLLTRDTESFDVPDRLPVLPLRDVVVFPYAVMPLLVGRAGSLAAIEAAVALKDRVLVLVAQRSAEVQDPGTGDLYRTGVDRGLASRAKIPASRFADVRTSDLARAPVETVKGIYDRFEMPWTPELERAYRETAAKHPKDAHGTHRYDLATFGLDEAEIDGKFADYHERFGLGARGERANSPASL